jgi:hypothetical protein
MGSSIAMTATIATLIHQIKLTPGSAIQTNGVSWRDYLALLQQLGHRRSTSIAYDHGVLEIRMPVDTHRPFRAGEYQSI